MPEALLALGGNVGNSRAILDRAIGLLCDGKEVRLMARSSDYLTPPWGFKYQPHFVNLAIMIETTLGPRELLARAQELLPVAAVLSDPVGDLLERGALEARRP